MIVFFDIDGTLVSDDEVYTIPESAVKAIRAARKNGHFMYIDTGRTVMNVEDKLRNIGFDGYICGCGIYIESGGKVIFNREPDKRRCMEIAELVHECDMTPMYEHSNPSLPIKDAVRLTALRSSDDALKIKARICRPMRAMRRLCLISCSLGMTIKAT